MNNWNNKVNQSPSTSTIPLLQDSNSPDTGIIIVTSTPDQDKSLRDGTANIWALTTKPQKSLISDTYVPGQVAYLLADLWVKPLIENEIQYDSKSLIYWQRYISRQFSEHLRVFKKIRDSGETEGSDWHILKEGPYRQIRIPYSLTSIEFAGIQVEISPMISTELTVVDTLELEIIPYVNIGISSTPNESFNEFARNFSKNFQTTKNKIYPRSSFFSSESWKIGHFRCTNLTEIKLYLEQSQHLIQIFIDSVLNAASIKQPIRLTPRSQPLVRYSK